MSRSALRCPVVFALLALLCCVHRAAAFDSFTATVSFYDGVNLTTGMTDVDPTVLTLIIGSAQEVERIVAPNIDPLFHFSSSVNLSFGFTTDPARPVALQPQTGVSFAMLDQTDPASLTEAQLAALDYAAQPVAVAPNQLVVAKLDNGAYRIIGQVAPNPDATVQFTVWTPENGSIPTVTPTPPVSVPEPGTFALFAVGIVGFWPIFKRIRQHQQGGNTMKFWKIWLFFGLYWVFNTSPALAVEVQVIVIGHGYVSGKEMSCMTTCTKSYEKGTVVQLKAIPFPDSQFAKWVVNGQPHTGTITVEEDTVISAVFELGSSDPKLADGITLYWYDGYGGRAYATIALDEMVIQLRDEAYWNSLAGEEYNTAISKIVEKFHPQAKNHGGKDYLMLKSPSPLEKDGWFAAVAALQQLQEVQWAGPMLYSIPGAPWTQLSVSNRIYVNFPANYSEEQINTVEQTYGLSAGEWLEIDKNFIYEVASPLEAINLANRLHESGMVESASPDIFGGFVPMSEPHDEYFYRQWHLKNATFRGEDINVLPAWNNGIRGENAIVAIVDDGMEFVHPDLGENMMPDAFHRDFLEGDHDPIDNNTGKTNAGVEILQENFSIICTPFCPSAEHGTSVAGIAAAAGFKNTTGVVGVAPAARLIGYRQNLCVPEEEICPYKIKNAKDAYSKLFKEGKEKSINVYNNSWGTSGTRSENKINSFNNTLYSRLEQETTQDNIIYVFGAGNMKEMQVGNERYPTSANTNHDIWTNNRYTIAVGASSIGGKAPGYSTPGATVLVNAPSGIYTTDRLGDEGYSTDIVMLNDELLGTLGTQCHLSSDFYINVLVPLGGQRFKNKQALLNAIETTAQSLQIDSTLIRQNIEFISTCAYLTDGNYTEFSGTSAAAPVVSGVVALMIDARQQAGKPPLSWRDVQYILIRTAHKNLGGPGEALEQEWKDNTNAAGYSHLDKYGFGRVDASAAVNMAAAWESLPPEEVSQEYVYGELGIGGRLLSDDGVFTHTFSVHEALQIEFVELTFSSLHPRWGDLEITLTSPQGTTSVMAETVDSEERMYDRWRLGSRRHVGESSQGDWTLTVRDKKRNGNYAASICAALKFYGTKLPIYGWTMTLPESGACEESGGGVVCSFGTPKPNGSTAHYGRMALLPKEANSPSVTLIPLASSETTYHGIHAMPDGLRFDVQPNAEWFGDCQQDTAEARCPDSLDCQGENANMPQCRLPDPQEKSETKSLPYRIATKEDREHDACQVTVTYTLPDGEHKEAVLEIQPARLCQTLTDWNGKTSIQEAQAICGWESVETTRLYASNERDDDDTTIVQEDALIGEFSKYRCRHIGPRSNEFYGCTEDPGWQKCPPPYEVWRTVPTLTGEGTRQVLISTTTYACGTWEEEHLWGSNYWHLHEWPVWALTDTQCFPYLIGWFRGTATTTYTNWSGEWVSQCQYQRAMQRIEPVNEMGLQISMPLNDPERVK